MTAICSIQGYIQLKGYQPVSLTSRIPPNILQRQYGVWSALSCLDCWMFTQTCSHPQWKLQGQCVFLSVCECVRWFSEPESSILSSLFLLFSCLGFLFIQWLSQNSFCLFTVSYLTVWTSASGVAVPLFSVSTLLQLSPYPGLDMGIIFLLHPFLAILWLHMVSLGWIGIMNRAPLPVKNECDNRTEAAVGLSTSL